jgi:hypothetical protein
MMDFLQRGVLRIVLSAVVASVLGALGINTFWSPKPPEDTAAERPADANRAGYVLLAFDQVVGEVDAYVRAGAQSEPVSFHQKLVRFREVLAVLEASGEDERRIAAALRSHSAEWR